MLSQPGRGDLQGGECWLAARLLALPAAAGACVCGRCVVGPCVFVWLLLLNSSSVCLLALVPGWLLQLGWQGKADGWQAALVKAGVWGTACVTRCLLSVCQDPCNANCYISDDS